MKLELISTLMEVELTIIGILLTLLVPYIFWKKTETSESSFFGWIGIKQPQVSGKRRFVLLTILGIAISTLISLVILNYMMDITLVLENFTTGKQVNPQTVVKIISVVLNSFFGSAFSEEVIFRGFIGKKSIKKFGIGKGNLIQSILSGLFYGLLFMKSLEIIDIVDMFIVMIVKGVMAWISGYINEYLSNGSIFPSWIINGTSKALSKLITLENLF